MKLTTLAATGLLLLSVAACGGSATSGSLSSPATSAPPATGLATAAPSATASGAPTGSATAITERDFKFDTPDVAVTGDVSLVVTNAGPTIHNLAIRDASGTVLKTTPDLKPGASATLTVSLPAATYAIICTLPGHESLGLKGTLTVAK